MDAKTTAKTSAKTNLLKEKLEKCLAQATAVACELQAIEQGDKTPHYDDIELPAHALGQRFSRMIQSERSCEVALGEAEQVVCPDCSSQDKVKIKRRVEIKRRTINSMDGPLEIAEAAAKCPRCRRAFFPSADRTRV